MKRSRLKRSVSSKKRQRMKVLTNRDVAYNGEVIADWSCDVNPETGEGEPNAGIENLVLFNGQIYSIIADNSLEIADIVLHPDRRAEPWELDEEDYDDHENFIVESMRGAGYKFDKATRRWVADEKVKAKKV